MPESPPRRVYEDFVCEALKIELERVTGSAQLQYRSHLDIERRVAMRPDLVWRSGSRTLTVIDAKYKEEDEHEFHHPDLYQVLAYCTVLGLDHGHLVYTKGSSEGVGMDAVRVAGGDVVIHRHALDLAEPPGRLLCQVSRLAGLIVSDAGSWQ